jgi:hypothetical protein
LLQTQGKREEDVVAPHVIIATKGEAVVVAVVVPPITVGTKGNEDVVKEPPIATTKLKDDAV